MIREILIFSRENPAIVYLEQRGSFDMNHVQTLLLSVPDECAAQRHLSAEAFELHFQYTALNDIRIAFESKNLAQESGHFKTILDRTLLALRHGLVAYWLAEKYLEYFEFEVLHDAKTVSEGIALEMWDVVQTDYVTDALNRQIAEWNTWMASLKRPSAIESRRNKIVAELGEILIQYPNINKEKLLSVL